MHDLLKAMKKDWPQASDTVLRVDGGMTASDWTMQNLATLLDAPVDRLKILETTAFGAAYLAGLQAGMLPPPEVIAKRWKRDRRFVPTMAARECETKLAGWADCIRKLQS